MRNPLGPFHAGSRLDALTAEPDRNPPTLSHRDRTGQDVHTIAEHPGYRKMERIAFTELGLASTSHRGALGDGKVARPVEKHVLIYLFAQAEVAQAELGLLCPSR